MHGLRRLIHEMNRRGPWPVLLATVAGCSSAAGNAGSPPPVPWPAGVYDLEAVIEYRYDGDSRPETFTDQYSAVLDIGPEGVMVLRDEGGLCRDVTRQEARADRDERARTFRCGRSEYALEVSGTTLSGAVTAQVEERLRMMVGCDRYRAGTRQCTRTRWAVNSVTTQKRASLTIVRRP